MNATITTRGGSGSTARGGEPELPAVTYRLLGLEGFPLRRGGEPDGLSAWPQARQGRLGRWRDRAPAIPAPPRRARQSGLVRRGVAEPRKDPRADAGDSLNPD